MSVADERGLRKLAKLRSKGRCTFVLCEDARGNLRVRPWRCDAGEVERVRAALDRDGVVFDKREFEDPDADDEDKGEKPDARK
jgi:hypothetical protein